MDTGTQSKVKTAVQSLLKAAARAHLWHLGTKSYAQHVALGDLYEYLHDAADKLAESSMGDGLVMEEPKMPEVLKELQAICKELRSIGGEPWLENITQEIDGAIYKYQYKIRNLS